MKTVQDYINALVESEGSVNTISSGAIANKEVPLGKIQKRKTLEESEAYDGENPLACNIGGIPLAGVGDEVQKLGDAIRDEQDARRFHKKQDYINAQTLS